MGSITKESIPCLELGPGGASGHLSGPAPTCEINTSMLSDTSRPPASKIISHSQQRAAAAAALGLGSAGRRDVTIVKRAFGFFYFLFFY